MIDQDVSFLETMDLGLVNDATMHIAGKLFDEWNDSNTDEGLFYSDYKFAYESDDWAIVEAFHKHWDVQEDDEYYIV